MKGHFLHTFITVAGLWLSAGQALAQIENGHYVAGTEGIQAGSLPKPGFYFDDINWFGRLDSVIGSGVNAQTSTYVNEPRLRWISDIKLLGANYGIELILPLVYQENSVNINLLGLHRHEDYGLFEVNDLEISPLLLSWHLKHFDFSAGYAFWVPTDDNTYPTIVASGGMNGPVPPPQFHWWEHMLTLGGTWYPDTAKNWAVSTLNHYEINQPFDNTFYSTQYGQLFTTEWGVSRMAGKYFNLGIVGNYSLQTTATRNAFGPYEQTYAGSVIEVGPEIKFSVTKCDLSVSLRYLRELNDPASVHTSDSLNVIALTLSKRF